MGYAAGAALTEADHMRSRGEDSFTHLPRFGARLYNGLTRTRAIEIQVKEIAQELVSRIDHGRLLDIGTGPGRLLLEIHRLNPNIELFGLDISEAMVQVAGQNLAGIKVDLRQGNIRQTGYDGNFFDLVTRTGSFYLWDQPENCLEEIHRILKVGQAAFLFETHRDYDDNEFRAVLRTNLEKETLFRRLTSPLFLKKQLKITYGIDEVAEIIGHTSFAKSYVLEKITLAGLPIWLRIKLPREP